MRQLAALATAALVFSVAGPAAVAQPFGDVPTNHWAYDAIARLAARGIIQGYPDQTFKGDRAMTRYEMAMVVARLLARVESIQMPAAPAPAPAPAAAAPPITRVDVETIQRLVNEFQAELTALGVRTQRVEEDLNALKAKIGNVRFGGTFRFRSDELRGPGPGSTAVNGNGNVSATDSSTLNTLPLSREIFKLYFDGSVAPDAHLIGAVVSCPGGLGGFAVNCSGYFALNSSTNAMLANIDSLFFDYNHAFGLPLEFWLGRWGCTQVGPCYATQFGPFGLLMNSTGDTWEDTTASGNFFGNNFADGLMARLSLPSLADLRAQGAIIRMGGGSFGTADHNAYGLDVNGQVASGLRLGAYYVLSSLYGGFPNTVTYGIPGYGGSLGASNGTKCTGSPIGITCDAAGNGWGTYVNYDVAPGVHLDGEWATWNDQVVAGSDNGYQVNVHWDLGALTSLGHNFSLDTGYLNFGPNFYSPYGAAEADIAMNDNLYPGNTNGFLFNTSYDIAQAWTLYGILFTGNTTSTGQPLSEYEAGIAFKFAPGAKITFKLRDESIANIDQFLLYRAEMDYAF